MHAECKATKNVHMFNLKLISLDIKAYMNIFTATCSGERNSVLFDDPHMRRDFIMGFVLGNIAQYRHCELAAKERRVAAFQTATQRLLAESITT
jgi:hypothetical protein